MMMMRCVAAGLVLACSSAAAGQGAPPSTDIFLAPVTMRDGLPSIGAAVNITNRPGYDNQPAFTPDGRILFTSTREDGQSDIYRYDPASKTTTRVTMTPESEYSATVMPGGKRFSVIRVERDSTQRLWSFAMDGSDPKLVIENLKPVGYQVWIDSTTLGLFVLGQPNALAVANVATGRVDTIARNIGRSLAAPPNSGMFSFVQRVDSLWHVSGTRRDASGAFVAQRMSALPPGAEYVVWLSVGTALTASGTRFFTKASAEAAWSDAGDMAASGLRSISRLAVSPDGKWVAFVAEPISPR